MTHLTSIALGGARLRPAAFLGGTLVVVLGTYLFAAAAPVGQHPIPAAPPASTSGPAAISAPDGPLGVSNNSTTRLDQAISVWSGNVERDRADWLSATNLAQLEMARGRLTGAVDDYARAATVVNLALGAYPANLGAQLLHAQLLIATHDFAGARRAAAAILAAHPDALQALATLGDAQLETGAYAEAAAS